MLERKKKLKLAIQRILEDYGPRMTALQVFRLVKKIESFKHDLCFMGFIRFITGISRSIQLEGKGTQAVLHLQPEDLSRTATWPTNKPNSAFVASTCPYLDTEIWSHLVNINNPTLFREYTRVFAHDYDPETKRLFPARTNCGLRCGYLEKMNFIEEFLKIQSARRRCSLFRSVTPKGILSDSDVIMPLMLNHEHGEIGITIHDIISPEHFYFNVASELEKLSNLKDAMMIFYRYVTEKHSIPTRNIVVGMYCAVRYFEEVLRGFIWSIRTYENTYVQVRLIDSGDCISVAETDVFYLLNEFGSLPAQGLSGRLTGVSMVGNKWQMGALEEMDRLVRKKTVFATVEPSPVKLAAYPLKVIIKGGGETINLADRLISSGNATRPPEVAT